MRKKRKNIPKSENFSVYLNKTRNDWLKIVSMLSFTLIPTFIVLDYIVMPDELFAKFMIFRLVVSGILIIQYIILRMSSRYASLHGLFITILAGTMIALMTNDLGGFDSGYYAGLNLVMMAVVILVPWGFAHGILNALTIIGIYAIVNVLNLHSFQIENLINNMYFLFSTALIAVSVSQIRLQLLRKEFDANIHLIIAKEEQDTIMNSVDEGLFIVQQEKEDEYVIGSQQSEAVTQILGTSSLAGKGFLEALSPYFPEKIITDLAEYLFMIFNRDVDNDLIRDLNPLEKLEADIPSELEIENKMLKFEFKPIRQMSGEKSYLISIKDVSKEVEMENRMLNNEIKAEHESQMMLAILQQGPAMLQDFVHGVETEISDIEKAISTDNNTEELSDAIETIFRAAHSMKGNAALLNLKFFAEQLDVFEEKIIELRDSDKLVREDLQTIESDLDIIKEVYTTLQGLIKNIQEFQGKKETETQETALESIPGALTELVGRISVELGKKVRLIAEKTDFTGLPASSAYIIRDILVQLTRNSITHGLEEPEARVKSGKDETGSITLNMQPDGDSFMIDYRDDGKSFDFAAIRKKGLESGKILESEVEQWNDTKLLKLIFDSGFSTAGESTMHAGRGVGMDIVKQRIKNMGGDFKIKYRQGEYTEFKITIPIKVLQEV
ncbi:MAG: ATP-binding protein [Leptospirales bacterium]